MSFSIRYISVNSSMANAPNETCTGWLQESIDSDLQDFAYENKFIELQDVTFSNLSDTPNVYKISTYTKIEILETKCLTQNILSKPNVPCLPIGLESTCCKVLTFLQQFSLSAMTQKSTFSEPTGLLLYGLQGCGKSQCLTILSNKKCTCDPKRNISLNFYEWYRQLKFIKLSSENCPPIHRNTKNVFQTWITNQLNLDSDANSKYSGLVILLPDLDCWKTDSLSSDKPDDKEKFDDNDNDGDSSQQNKLYTTLCHNLKSISSLPVCVLATSTDCQSLLKHRNLRNLFYRHLLVSLPNGEQRFRILSGQLAEYTRSSSQLSVHSNDMQRLKKLAASLHGYTSRDLCRIMQASFGAAVTDCYPIDPLVENESNVEDASKNKIVDPSIPLIVEKLEQEACSYRPSNLSAEMSTFAPLHWSDIGGYADIKQLLITTVQQRLVDSTNPTSFAAKADALLRLDIPRGILLHGPPGCSKTLFVRALATECNLPLIAVQASRIFGRYVGDSERNMQRILVHARACAPAILFIDEIDLLLPSRSSGESGVSEHVLGEVLTVMDGVEGQCGQLMLIAATNRLDNLDSALRRAGRFDITIPVPPPNTVARTKILQIELSKRSSDSAVLDETWLSSFSEQKLPGYTGAEVVSVVQSAAELARTTDLLKITRHHLTCAQKRVPASTMDAYNKQSQKSDLNSLPNDQQDIQMHTLRNSSCLPSRYTIMAYIFAAISVLIHFLTLPFIFSNNNNTA